LGNEKFKIKERDMLKKIPIITLSVQQCEQNHIRKVIYKNKLDNLSEKEKDILFSLSLLKLHKKRK
jgi:hypothetical protein